MPHIRLKLKQNKLSITWDIMSLNNVQEEDLLVLEGQPICYENVKIFMNPTVRRLYVYATRIAKTA